ncbi:MAG: lytic transglycosylase domain-containing protein [Telmatospirillum sp.]|nr:lytic transglycosylase domain-containing protein [Telmatospirillum sp.]
MRNVLLAALALLLLAGANMVYHIARKPAEMLFPVAGVLKKMPSATWDQYGPLFREYSTAQVSPELLAALAQVEGAGDPVAHTYWRWRPTWNLLSLYQPASSAVGMYQMTDPTFSDARRYCIRQHKVVAATAWGDWQSCWFTDLYTRVLPSHAVQLTAISLDRSITAILARAGRNPGRDQTDELAAVIHLCGAGTARSYADRGFRLAAGERCGDHEAARYVGQVVEMIRQFRRLSGSLPADHRR